MSDLIYLKILLFILGPIAIVSVTIKIIREYERAVVFRLGKLICTKGPGLILLLPFIDRIKKVDLRLVSIDVPRQDIMTRDNVPVTVDAVVYYHIVDPSTAVITIKDIQQSTFLIAQATLRNILGQVELDELLSQQAKINQKLGEILSEHTKQWGITISIVEIKEVTLPEEMKRVMAKQAEAERERRARLIDARAEYEASQTLAEAGKILSDNPQGLQLRYLYTLRDISTNKGSTILFPLPMDLLSPFLDGIKGLFKIDKKVELKEPEKKTELKTEEELRIKKDIKEDTKIIQEAVGTVSMDAEYEKELREGRLRPRYVQWVITDKCQFGCSHCEIAGIQSNIKELTTEQAKNVVNELAELGCEFLSITGGEPMLRRDLFDIARYAKDRGLKLGLTTNGHATEEYILELSDIKFDSVVLTLDGYGETQNKIRNAKDSYEHGIRTIEFFNDIGVQRICVSTTLLEDNIKGFPRMTEDVFRARANLMQVQPRLFNNGQPMRNKPETVKEAFRFILEAKRRGFPVEAGEQFGYLGPLEPLLHMAPFFCGIGWNTFCVSSNGNVQGCPLPAKEDITEGNCLMVSLKDIWQKKFSSFRKDIPEGLPDGCHRCPYLAACKGGCWLFRVYGLNPCFLLEAEQVYREISSAALYPHTT